MTFWQLAFDTLGVWGIVAVITIISVLILGLADKLTGGHIVTIITSIFSSRNKQIDDNNNKF
jgi:hypothetical protein